MTIKFLSPTSARFIQDIAPYGVTGCTGNSTADIDTAYAAWLILNPLPPPPPAPITILALPTYNPGITGALHLINNTLLVSNGPSASAVQIGTTGPTGGAAI